MRVKLLIASLALLGVAVAGPSHANTTYTWDFATSTDNGVEGITHQYLSNQNPAFTLDAYGFDGATAASSSAATGSTWAQGTSVAAHKLFEKYTSGNASETGLGLDISTDNEIRPTTFINLDAKNLKDNGLGNLKLKIGSIQTGEDYYVWGSNDTGGENTSSGHAATTYTLLSGTEVDSGEQSTFSVSNTDLGLYRYFTVSAKPNSSNSSDVLIDNGASAEAVPEASTLIGFGSLLSLGGLAAVRNRKKTA